MTTIETEVQRDAQREIIRQSFTDIVHEIEIALQQAGLTDPVFMIVPTTGLSLVTISTPVDPIDDDEWEETVKVACQVVGKKLGISLSNRPLLCRALNTTMSATELTTD